MTEVAEGTPNTGVAPLAVLGGHPDDEPADRVHAPWAARSATAAAVVCPRDQLSMPAEEGIGRDQGVPVTASPSPETLGLCGPAPALGVGEPETARTELLSEDAILFLERVHDVTRLLVDLALDRRAFRRRERLSAPDAPVATPFPGCGSVESVADDACGLDVSVQRTRGVETAWFLHCAGLVDESTEALKCRPKL